MAVTALGPETALIAIDLQKGLVSLPAIHPIEGVVTRVRAMAAAFREQGLPVVLVNVAAHRRSDRTAASPSRLSGRLDRSHSELNRQNAGSCRDEVQPGAFTKTDLEAYLQALGVTQIVLTGIATSNGVEVTARQAYELGFNVRLRDRRHDGRRCRRARLQRRAGFPQDRRNRHNRRNYRSPETWDLIMIWLHDLAYFLAALSSPTPCRIMSAA